MTGRGGLSRGRFGVNVLRRSEKTSTTGHVRCLQVVKFVHDELLHAFHRVVKLGVGSTAPDVRFSHLGSNKLRKKSY